MDETSQTSLHNLFAAIVILAFTFIVYSQVLSFGFVNWDDDVYLLENTHAQSLAIEDIGWFFTHAYYYSYIPLAMISHALDFKLWGFNPTGHHLTSIILHSLNALGVFVLSLQILSILRNGLAVRGLKTLLLEETDTSILFAGACTAILFAWHPLRVESVAWISDRKDLLCTLFLLASTIDYINHVATNRSDHSRRSYMTSFVLFCFACLSKSIAFVTPVVFLLFDFFLLRKHSFRKERMPIFIEKIPFFIVSALVVIVAANVAPEISSSDMFTVVTPVQRAFLPFYNLTFYLTKSLAPISLSPMYPLAGEGEMMLSFVLFAVLSILCLWLWKKGMTLPLFAWLCYIIMLAPSSSFASAIIQTTADRYSYLPSVALCLFFGGMAGELLRRFSLVKSNQILIACTALLIVSFLGFVNVRQQRVWMNSEALWGKAIVEYPDMPLPYNNFGLALQARDEIEPAAKSFERAIQLKPNYLEAHLNLGNIMFAKGNWEEAERLLLSAAEINPNQAEVYNNLGVVANTKGNALEALRWFRKSVEVNPEYGQGYFNLAALLEKMGNTSASVDALKKAAQLGHPGAQENLKTQNLSW